MKLAATGLIVLALTALTGCWRYNEPYGSASPYSESRKACEANGGTGLEMTQVGRPPRQFEASHAGADCSGADQRDTFAHGTDALELIGQRLQPLARQRARVIGEDIGPHLDHDRVGQRDDFLSNRINHKTLSFPSESRKRRPRLRLSAPFTRQGMNPLSGQAEESSNHQSLHGVRSGCPGPDAMGGVAGQKKDEHHGKTISNRL